jgi:serine/threonine protein kinase
MMASLTDFGCLKFVDFKTPNPTIYETVDNDDVANDVTYTSKTGAGVGTIAYMPPRAFQMKKGEKVGFNSFKMDAFALGATLYELLNQGTRYMGKLKAGNETKEFVTNWDGKLTFKEYA